MRVPYKGEQPGLTDLLGGQISAAFISPGTAGRYPGKLKLLAVSGEQRVPGIEVPTFIERGFPSLTVQGWGGVFVPSITPAPIVHKLSAEMMRIGVMPEVVERTLGAGFSIAVADSRDFSRFVQEEMRFWKQAVQEFHITVG